MSTTTNTTKTTKTTETTAPMRAFHNDPAIKLKYLQRVRAHARHDEIVHGTYWQNGKGCAVGCTIHSDEHDAYERELGIPTVIAHLEDQLFESMPNGAAKLFPAQLLNAIPVGADLSLVIPKFMHWLLVDPDDGVLRFAQEQKIVDEAIRHVATLYELTIDGLVVVTRERWRKAAQLAQAARAAAALAAASQWSAAAARAAAEWSAAAAQAARAAAEAAEASEWSAEWSAARSAAAQAARSAARSAATVKQTEKLLQLLSEAPCN